jgi:hypothetical protein
MVHSIVSLLSTFTIRANNKNTIENQGKDFESWGILGLGF